MLEISSTGSQERVVCAERGRIRSCRMRIVSGAAQALDPAALDRQAKALWGYWLGVEYGYQNGNTLSFSNPE